MSKKKESACCQNGRLGRVGGQAVLEGVMMKCKNRTALAVREESGNIRVETSSCTSIREKYKFFRIPIIRGIANFVESMIHSYKTLMRSAEMLGLDEIDEESKAEMWLRKHLGNKFMAVLSGISMVLGVALALGLFMFLPSFLTKLIDSAVPGGIGWFRNLIEGLIKIAIFVLYICGCSLLKDMRRTFEYHGAEHKSIACYEAGLELTPENAKTCSRFHPRCGTSFIFVILIISILVNSIVPWDVLAFRFAIKILLLPLIVGIGFEFISFAGKHTNIFTRILSAPGLWMQRITTKEPDERQLEVAIAALKHAMPEEFPEVNEAPADETAAEAEDTAVPTDDPAND